MVERTLDLAFKNNQSFLLDGTLSSVESLRAKTLCEHCGNGGESTYFVRVSTSRELAWEFVQVREQEEGRRILPDIFIHQFLGAQQVIRELKQEFGGRIRGGSFNQIE